LYRTKIQGVRLLF